MLEAFVVAVGEDATAPARALVRTLRSAGIAADASFGSRAMKGQLRAADRAGARYALILGERELADGTITVRELASGDQASVEQDEVVAWISRRR
jgi:histidyl-tRNA synthetase